MYCTYAVYQLVYICFLPTGDPSEGEVGRVALPEELKPRRVKEQSWFTVQVQCRTRDGVRERAYSHLDDLQWQKRSKGRVFYLFTPQDKAIPDVHL